MTLQEPYNQPKVTIELTSKSLKRNFIISWLIFFVGIALFFIGIPFAKSLGLIMILVGVAWFIVTKIKTWWNHK
ncbi:MAG: hypothetical protein A3C50_04020 [Candidatus Staskawiczbacteria bacterium RIFCSPHIGHO2_02_FULL_43_16]|uniref:Uncharacterized protein n=1 Tax=Candidatus Staskawiczbacteria bacterium RIFCSPHIGHO2_01_FULL_41_41 TaxID=1802203 RepID=A0A1G2HTB5_9BACT|nr:MAG: hypothetical protein A2822_00305 [Candidatus Staskawiczbacteria bacterium RIFCSPHIGHO2_01_FULL_41_41]OGZ68097.1 MAG: hypothetical protein A3C50_04020 [Candidatus Staskawiczbacteria bacterium RIFCSPHIGHO2_02_FULL_43_16]OGZ74835.1 MAG: hypothetical protein A3A12_03210 [Candidatus Staskawiczbacteria bacterium RIFCSPLOWO2_01_FULL_43_17b]